MKCKNCGTENDAKATRCKHCNAPLDGSMIEDQNFFEKEELLNLEIICKNCKTVNISSALRCVNCNAPLDGSMLTNPSISPTISHDTTTQPAVSSNDSFQQLKICPNCDYPNVKSASSCVQCGTPLIVKQEDIPATFKDSTQEGKKIEENQIEGRTVNPWIQIEQPSIGFSLVPIGLNEEEGLKKDFKGQNVELSRKNLDPNNPTITTQGQAVIFQKEGQWYLMNKSELKTTFIRVEEPIVIEAGDIILMGNRQFRFES